MGVLSGCILKGKNEFIIGGEVFLKFIMVDILGCNSGFFIMGLLLKWNVIILRFVVVF